MLTPPPSTMPVMPRLFISRKNLLRAVDLLLHGRLRQLVENLAERIAVGVDRCRSACCRCRARACRRARHRRRRGCSAPPSPSATAAASHRDAGCRRDCRAQGRDLRRGRPALLGELLLGPAAGDDDPGSGLLRPSRPGRIFSSASFSVGTPIQFTSVPKVSAARMPWMCPSVRPGITVRPPRSISLALLAGELLHRGRGAGGQHLAMPDRQRLLRGEILVDGEDLAVEQDRVGGLRRCDAVRGPRERQRGE